VIQIMQDARLIRDRMISMIEWRKERHRDELELSLSTTLSNQQYLDLLAYIQNLRECLDGLSDPSELEWPSKPAFITEY
jgi:hypothetical protein